MVNESKKYLSIREAAEVYNLSESFLYKRSMEGSIPLIKIGLKRVIIPVADFEKWLDAHRVDTKK